MAVAGSGRSEHCDHDSPADTRGPDMDDAFPLASHWDGFVQHVDLMSLVIRTREVLGGVAQLGCVGSEDFELWMEQDLLWVVPGFVDGWMGSGRSGRRCCRHGGG